MVFIQNNAYYLKKSSTKWPQFCLALSLLLFRSMFAIIAVFVQKKHIICLRLTTINILAILFVGPFDVTFFSS